MSRGRECVATVESRRQRKNPKTTRRVTVFRFFSQHRTGLLGRPWFWDGCRRKKETETS